MILSRVRSHPRSKFYAMALVLLGVLSLLVVETQRLSWTGGARLFCVFYAGVISVFFIAQIVAFVVGHTNYSDSVEQPKFDLLKTEEKEWTTFHEHRE